jgi:phytoene desaturase
VPNNLSGINWEDEKDAYAKKILDALERTLLPGLSDNMDHCIIKTPDDFEHDYSSEHGSGFSIAPTFYQSAWFRFHNKSEGPDNLYLAGAGTHPGAGVPGVLSSAKVVDNLIPSIG